MKKIILLAFIALFPGCQNLDLSDNTHEMNGLLEDGLAYDGCALHFYTSSNSGALISYVPTPGTEKKTREFLTKQKVTQTSGPVPVTLKYRPTDTKGNLRCGWGSVFEVDAIEVLKIRKQE